jgi:hypothetical protein
MAVETQSWPRVIESKWHDENLPIEDWARKCAEAGLPLIMFANRAFSPTGQPRPGDVYRTGEFVYVVVRLLSREEFEAFWRALDPSEVLLPHRLGWYYVEVRSD